MRVLFVVQRYGAEVLGGGERAARDYATRMAEAGHHVEVLTSRATSYIDWADVYPAGAHEDAGVVVHRLSVRAPRSHRFFGPLHDRVVSSRRPVALHVQREWMHLQGPELPELPAWLQGRARDFDVVVFFTYLYAHAWYGLRATAGLAPTVLHPLAHDEPPLKLSIFDAMFRLADGFAFLTEEEQALVTRRFGVHRPSIITGVGLDLAAIDRAAHDAEGFRRAFGIGSAPYLLYAGRVDASKGATELVDAYRAYSSRHGDAPVLVLLGEAVSEVQPAPGVVLTGAVDEATKEAAISGCLALVQPSYFESFSIVLSEAWAHRKPAIVQGHCEVLTGQARRSGGAIPYRGYAELEAAIEMLCADPTLRAELGAAGRRYVERHYRWEDLLGRYEGFLREVAGGWQRAPVPERRRRLPA